MTKIIKPKVRLYAGPKGGVGKTTGCRHTHIKEIHMGLPSILLDCDISQWSQVGFNKRREFYRNHPDPSKKINVPQLNIVKINSYEQLKNTILEYAKKTPFINIDVGAAINSDEAKLALKLADELVVWCKYGPEELAEFSKMNKAFADSGNTAIPATIIPNEISSNINVMPTQLHKMRQCAKIEAPLFKVSRSYICRRDAFQIASEGGVAVFELKGKEKNRSANFEFNNYFDEVINHG